MSLANIVLMLMVVLLSSVAQVVLKIGTSPARLAPALADGAEVARFAALLASPMVWLGLALYVAATVAYLRVLSVVDLSQAYSFNALSYLLTMGAGFLWLHEVPHATRLLGGALILCGVALISWR